MAPERAQLAKRRDGQRGGRRERGREGDGNCVRAARVVGPGLSRPAGLFEFKKFTEELVGSGAADAYKAEVFRDHSEDRSRSRCRIRAAGCGLVYPDVGLWEVGLKQLGRPV